MSVFYNPHEKPSCEDCPTIMALEEEIRKKKILTTATYRRCSNRWTTDCCHTYVFTHHKYCPMCGAKIITEMKQEKKK